jgi:hypothetical protein
MFAGGEPAVFLEAESHQVTTDLPAPLLADNPFVQLDHNLVDSRKLSSIEQFAFGSLDINY